MQTSRLVLAGTALIAVVTHAAPADDAAAKRQSRGSAKMIFFDDFSKPDLDRSSWNVEVSGDVWNNEQQCYIDSPETAYIVSSDKAPGSENGALVIHPRFRPGTKATTGRSYDFTSARLNTKGKVDVTHGTVAARIRMPDATGVWPAFWLLGTGDWPDSGEIDIMEYVGEKDWTGVAVHGPGYSGETPIVNKFFFEPGSDVTDWHVYSVDWSPKELVFRTDGRVTYRATRAMIEHYGEWRFDTPEFIVVNFALGGAYPFKTNGIREPYNGLPAETVDQIKADKLKMEVDWVKVTQ
jgi:beta-glucanase (GH16 family)